MGTTPTLTGWGIRWCRPFRECPGSRPYPEQPPLPTRRSLLRNSQIIYCKARELHCPTSHLRSEISDARRKKQTKKSVITKKYGELIDGISGGTHTSGSGKIETSSRRKLASKSTRPLLNLIQPLLSVYYHQNPSRYSPPHFVALQKN